jgi:hypothetical protein
MNYELRSLPLSYSRNFNNPFNILSHGFLKNFSRDDLFDTKRPLVKSTQSRCGGNVLFCICFLWVFYYILSGLGFCTAEDIHPGSSLNLRVMTYNPKGQKIGETHDIRPSP